MGEFSYNCAMSNFTIFPGDRIKFLLLNPKQDTFMGEFFEARSLPISREYDGYGRIIVDPKDLDVSKNIENYIEYFNGNPSDKFLTLENRERIYPCYIVESVYSSLLKLSEEYIKNMNFVPLKDILYLLF